MCEIVIVPNVVRDKINESLDAALLECPEAEREREILYKKLLTYFNETGTLPEIKIVSRSVASF